MRYLLEHGDDHFIKDSVTIREGRLKDADRFVDAAEVKELIKLKKDNSIWQFTSITLSTHLNNCVPFFRTLEGEAVDIYSLFDKYLILHEYTMSGYSKFDCILINEKIRELKKLNEEFAHRIQLVLVNRDELAAQ